MTPFGTCEGGGQVVATLNRRVWEKLWRGLLVVFGIPHILERFAP